MNWFVMCLVVLLLFCSFECLSVAWGGVAVFRALVFFVFGDVCSLLV